MHNFQYTKEEVSKPLASKKKFLNAYKAKENKVIVPNQTEPSQIYQNTESEPTEFLANLKFQSSGSQILKELASNEKIVEWVSQIVSFHKYKNEEKRLLDLVLQGIYKVLFPQHEQVQSLMQIAQDLEMLVLTCDHLLPVSNKNPVLTHIINLKYDINFISQHHEVTQAELILVKLSQMIQMFKYQDIPSNHENNETDGLFNPNLSR